MSRESEADLRRGRRLPGALPEALRAELIAFRRDLHMHPELGNQEFRTTAAAQGPAGEGRPRAPRARHRAPGSSVTSATPGRRDARCWPCAPTSTPCPSRTPRPTARTAPPCPTAPTPAATTSTPPSSSAPASSSPSCTAQGLLPHPVRLIFQPAEEVLPGGAADAIECGALEGVGADHRRALRPQGRRRADRAAHRPHHLRLRPAGGLARRPRRPHRPPPPHHRPRHRRRPGRHRRARPCSPAASTPAAGSPSPGAASSPATPATSSRSTPSCPAPSAAWTCTPGGPRPTWCTRPSTRSPTLHRAKSEINYVRGVPAGRQRPGRHRAAARRHDRPPRLGLRRGHRAEPRRRGLLLVPGARARRHGPPGRPHSRATRTVRDLHQGDFDVDEDAITVGVELFTAAALLDAER